ncbi:MAG: response regulator [Phycisphaerae bacterium]|nr:response regulator [Phycisphaerae bacterium]
MKVMLVDDSRTIRNIEKNVLGQLGYTEILEAGDGIEALSVMEGNMPELMLVDWNMPNMDGLTLVKTVREKGVQVPIIMVTTEAEKARVVEAIKAGVNNYVVKPFTADTLGEKIKQTLAKLAGVS